jgi:ferri-bacillibactin esterase
MSTEVRMKLVSLHATEVHSLRSEEIGQDFEIRVAHPIPRAPRPGMPGAAEEDFPVLYVLDGDLFFATAVEMSRIMQLFGEMPPMVVVGIGYGDAIAQGELRNRDLTPCRDPSFEAMGAKQVPDHEFLLPEDRRYGGATMFRTFLTDSVRPLVASLFPLRAGSETIFGSSLGGLFALHTLLTEPETFDRYIMASPAIWWSSEMLFEVERAQSALCVALESKVFMGVGALEEGTGMPWLDAFKSVTNVRKMSERLAMRADSTLKLTTHVFDDETHTSVIAAVLTRGLRAVVGPVG